MPPKKDAKKEALSKPDNSGIPKQDIEFKLTLTIQSDSPEPPSYGIMFEWFGNLSDKLERYETPLIESWKKEQNLYNFQRQFDLLRIDDDFCKAIVKKQFYCYFVNAEDNKVQDQLYFDYSSLLTVNEGQPKFQFESKTIRVLNIDAFSLTLTADKPLLGEVYRHYLNPFEVEVIGAKDLPVEKSSKYEPAYIKYQFFNGQTAQTHALVGTDKLLWSHKHVFLLGFMNPTDLKEKMRSNYLKFQLHDRDEVNNKKIKADVEVFDIGKAIQQEMQKEKPVEEDPKKKGQPPKKEEKKEVKKQAKKQAKKKDAKLGEPILPPKKEVLLNNYGVSACSLVQFLKPTMRSARYKIPVVPRNTFQDFQSKNIDLNTTARNQMQKVIASNNYFDCDTVLVVGFNMAFPIGTFVKPPPPKQEVVEDPKKKKDPKDVKEVPPPPVEKQEKEPSKDVFERIVYIVPYKDAATVKTIQDIFYNCNQKAFNLKNRREITTHLLTNQEQVSKTLDYITGFEVADPQGRIYILEGLKNGAIQEYHKAIIRNSPNTKDFKIFKNSSISFSSRLFASFHLQIKRIRLRPSLSQLLLQPSIYIKSKVAEEISQNLNKLADLRKICDDLATADAMNLWPSSQWIIQIQRKFSQSLSPEDITGVEAKPAKKDTAEDGLVSKTIRFLENTDLKVVTADQFFLPKINQNSETSPFPQTGFTDTAHKRTVMTKTFTKDAGKQMATYQMRGKSAQIPQGQQVYTYAGQKNNFYEKQLRDLREEMKKNPNIIYTYNKDFFRLAIDPHVLEEEAKKDMEMSLSKMYSKDKFSSLLVRTKEERMRLPNRLPQEAANDMKKFPYHQEKARERDMKKNGRDIPPTNGNQDFKKYLRKQQVFSEYKPVQGEKLSPVEQQKIQREQKQRYLEQQKKKLKGDPSIKVKKGYFAQKSYGVDRFKDIRQGEAKKLGIVDVDKRSKSKKAVAELQVSYNLKEQPIDPSYNPLIRRDNDSLNIQKDQFNYYQGKEVLTRTQVYKPLKDTL